MSVTDSQRSVQPWFLVRVNPGEALSILVKMAITSLGQASHLPLHENLHVAVLHHHLLHHLQAGQVSIQNQKGHPLYKSFWADKAGVHFFSQLVPCFLCWGQGLPSSLLSSPSLLLLFPSGSSGSWFWLVSCWWICRFSNILISDVQGPAPGRQALEAWAEPSLTRRLCRA